jgi:nuclear transport factor 2 (NTF2) superfamily protein
MVFVKKSANGGGAPNFDILAAKLRIIEAELSLEEKQVNLDNGRSFMAEPNLNVKVEVVKNLVEPGNDEGVKFFDRFKLKKNDDGDWTFAKYSKLGNLIAVRYGEEWFEDETAEFEETDFENWEFVAQVEPKTDSKGKPLTGSTINWKGLRAAGGADEETAQELKVEAGKNPHEGLMRARKAATEAKASAEAENEEDFDEIPF